MKLILGIVNTNETKLLMRCLDSIFNQEIRLDYHVVVVDNNSQDNVLELLRESYPEITVVAKKSNDGYASAVNEAIRALDSEYALILNPDIIIRPGALDTAIDYLDEHQDIGIAGAKLLNPDGTVQFSCRTFYTLPILLYRRMFLGKLFPNSPVITRHLMSDWDHNSVRDVDWVLGACMLVRRSALHEVGLMDDGFFLYFEDVDWCYRMHRHGWRVCYLPDAEMIHDHQRKSAKGFMNKNARLHLTSMLRFYSKWGKIPLFLRKNLRN